MSAKHTKVVPFPEKKIFTSEVSKSSIDVSASLDTKEPALTIDELRDQVARIVMQGTIRESSHSAQDRSYRNVSQDDILAMLEGSWVLVPAPEWDAQHRNWKYKISGTDIEGDPLVLIIAVNVEMERIDIITKF